MKWDQVLSLYNRASKVERYAEYAREMLKLVEQLRDDDSFSEVSVSNAYLNLVFEIPAEATRVHVFREEDVGTYCIFVEGREESTAVSVDLVDVKTQILRYLKHNG
jgi:hypothetical protein